MPDEEPPATIEDAIQSGVLPGFLRRFIVDDLTCHLCRRRPGQVIMLFESPHIMEVLADHPLAGTSGRRVFDAVRTRAANNRTRVANNNCPYTIGEVLQCRWFDRFPCFQRIGVMNVSRLPLQKKAYPYSIQRQLPSDLLSTFNVIYKHPRVFASRRNRKHRYFAEMVCNDLQDRITRINSRLGARNVEFVTCGEAATWYANRLRITVRHTLSHPARGNWRNSNNVQEMVRWLHNLP